MCYLFNYQTASFIERCYHGQGMCSSLTTVCSDRKMDGWMSDCDLYGLEGCRWMEEIEGEMDELSVYITDLLYGLTHLCVPSLSCFNCLLDSGAILYVSGAVDML